MRHIKAVSAQKPACADELSTLTALISFLSSILSLVQQISDLLGISSYLDAKSSEE